MNKIGIQIQNSSPPAKSLLFFSMPLRNPKKKPVKKAKPLPTTTPLISLTRHEDQPQVPKKRTCNSLTVDILCFLNAAIIFLSLLLLQPIFDTFWLGLIGIPLLGGACLGRSAVK